MVKGVTVTEAINDIDNDRSYPILIACKSLPPMGGGTPTIMKNLIDGFHPDRLVLATKQPRNENRDSQLMFERHKLHYVTRVTGLPGRWERFRRRLMPGLLSRRLMKIAKQNECKAIVGVYPDLLFLDASQRAAKRLKLPFFPYLHDTVAEAANKTRYAKWANNVQNRVFDSADAIFVATHGMAELYKKKYNMDTIPIVHIYPEEIPDKYEDIECDSTLFWSGNAYNINQTSLKRVYDAMSGIENLRFTFASVQTRDDLKKMGMENGRIDTTYIPVSKRPEYIEFIKKQGILVLALSWPDETNVPEEELSTIFPTKTPEYLASGRPILVHCPKHYHLARFLRENDCGEIVSERSVDAIAEKIRQILTSEELRKKLGRNSLKAAHQFRPDKVLPVFKKTVEK